MIRSGKGVRLSIFCSIFASIMLLPLYAGEEAAGESEDLSLTDLLNVKVTIASKTAESISDAPGVISVITPDELKRFGGTTLADVLKRVPGFLGSTSYFSDRSMIAARGDQIPTSSSHVLFLLNGRPMRENMQGGIKSEVYESFPVNIIDHIEVIRGPGSVLYGSQAFSAVINVITKSAKENTASISGAVKDELTGIVAADARYKIGDAGVIVAARYADKGEWKTGYSAAADIPGVTSGVVHHMDVAIPDNGPGAYAELNYKDMRLMGSYTEWNNFSFIPDAEFLNTIGSMDKHAVGPVVWKKYFGDFGYMHNITEWYSTSVNVTYTYSYLKAIGFPHTMRNSYEAMGEFTNFFIPFKNFNVVLGGTYALLNGEEENADHDTSDWNRGIYTKGHYGNFFSSYVQSDYRWKWCKVIGGLQVNKVFYKDSLGKKDDFNFDFNPRAGLILYPFKRINVKAFYSTAYRAPSMNELYLNFQTLAGKMVPRNDNPAFASWKHEYDLKPEKVNTYDLGANYQVGKAEFGINGFYSRMNNLIVQRNISPTLNIYDNLGEADIYGVEYEGKFYLAQSLFFEGSLLYQESRNIVTDEKNVTPLPDFSAKAGLNYESEFGLTIGCFNTFQQSVDPKYYDTLNPGTKAFNMANIHCSYDLKNYIHVPAVKELELVLNIDNLFDKDIWLPAWGLYYGEMIPYNQGRRIYGGFKVSF